MSITFCKYLEQFFLNNRLVFLDWSLLGIFYQLWYYFGYAAWRRGIVHSFPSPNRPRRRHRARRLPLENHITRLNTKREIKRKTNERTMLVGRKRPGVDVQVRIDFYGRHMDTTRFQQRTDGRGDYAFAHAAHNAAGDQYVLHGFCFTDRPTEKREQSRRRRVLKRFEMQNFRKITATTPTSDVWVWYYDEKNQALPVVVWSDH